jgi:hypothetical protein
MLFSLSLSLHIYIIFLFFYYCWGGTKSLGTAATSGLLYKPQMIAEGDCGAIGGMKVGRGNRSTLRKPAPEPLCPPQIPHVQTQARTRATAVGSQRLTAILVLGENIVFCPDLPVALHCFSKVKTEEDCF